MLDELLRLLPNEVSREIARLERSVRDFSSSLSEIRLRGGGVSALVLHGKNVPLTARLCREELSRVLGRLCHGSLYAYRDTLAKGYVPFVGGVRVGVVGQARYEGGRLVGVSDLSALVFRIPSHPCDTAEELYRLFLDTRPRGMLLYSPPGGGKTTALRALAGRLGDPGACRRIVVVDERCEFCADAYEDASVDILRGYERSAGIELATRVLSPEVILVDEIGSRGEAEAMVGVLRAGVSIVATAHAAAYGELCRRVALAPFFEHKIFDVFVGIFSTGGVYSLKVDRVE